MMEVLQQTIYSEIQSDLIVRSVLLKDKWIWMVNLVLRFELEKTKTATEVTWSCDVASAQGTLLK